MIGGEVAHGVEKPVQTLVVLGSLGVAGGGDDADAAALAQQAQDAREGRVVRGQVGAVVVEGDVTVEGDEVRTIVSAYEAQQLGGVENETDVVEGGGDEATAADDAGAVLPREGVFEVQGGEEGADGGDQQLELGFTGGADAGVVGMVVDELFDVAEDLRIAVVSVGGDDGQGLAALGEV